MWNFSVYISFVQLFTFLFRFGVTLLYLEIFNESKFEIIFLCFSCDYLLPLRWRRPGARRCARLNRTWGPMTSASWARCLGTLNCQTLTAMGSLLILAVVWENPSQRTRNRPPQNLSFHLLPKELTCTPELSSLSPSSSLMWFIGLYTCDYLALLYLLPTLAAYKAFQLTTEKCEPPPKRITE